MHKITATGAIASLPEGGVVASSFLGIGDGAVKVWVENKPNYFGVSKLFEYPADGSTVPEGFKDAALSASRLLKNSNLFRTLSAFIAS